MAWLDYANLSDHYERKARFLPAVLSVLPLLPVAAAWGSPFIGWIELVLGGAGIGAVVASGLSHVASAMGNRLQNELWPCWPHDSPTNRWLHPSEERISGQQRELWYAAVKRLVGIDIAAAVAAGDQVEAVINDAVASLRNLFWKRPEAERLRLHDVDYGFARNLTGMRPIWMGFLLVGTVACWLSYILFGADALMSALVSTLLSLIFVPVGIWVLPGYVRTKATYYAESFFGTLRATDEAQPSRREIRDPR